MVPPNSYLFRYLSIFAKFERKIHRRPRFSPKAEIFADGQDFRRGPRFLPAAQIFADGRDFRRRPRFSPTPQILADGRARFKPSSRGVWGAAAPQENVCTQLTAKFNETKRNEKITKRDMYRDSSLIVLLSLPVTVSATFSASSTSVVAKGIINTHVNDMP